LQGFNNKLYIYIIIIITENYRSVTITVTTVLHSNPSKDLINNLESFKCQTQVFIYNFIIVSALSFTYKEKTWLLLGNNGLE